MVRKYSLSVFFILSVLLGACALETTQEPAPLATQQLVETVTPESVPPTEAVSPTEMPAANDEWVTYHDPRYGVGLAYPCWWTFTPMPGRSPSIAEVSRGR